MKTTIEDLKTMGACAPGIEWFARHGSEPDWPERLARAHPKWIAWAIAHGVV